MTLLPGFNDPIDMGSWNSATENAKNAQNASNPIKYHQAFGHHLLRLTLFIPLNRVFAKALIITPPPPTVLTIALIALAMPAVPVASACRSIPTSIFNNVCDSTKRRKRCRGTTICGSTRGRESHGEIPTSQSYSFRKNHHYPYLIGPYLYHHQMSNQTLEKN